jgi:multicomponent Na+:H+ antiporter subunit A
MDLAISVIVGFMILGALYAIHARDLLSSVIACGIVGYCLVICFLLLNAPDLAIVQIVVDTITLIIMVAVVLDSSRQESYSKPDLRGSISDYSRSSILLYCFNSDA